MPHLAPDYAYVPVEDFYELPHFDRAYAKAAEATVGFTRVSAEELAGAIQADPVVLLPLRDRTRQGSAVRTAARRVHAAWRNPPNSGARRPWLDEG